MTIEDIKKALEICSKDDGCRECPYYDYHHCDKALLKDILALINELCADELIKRGYGDVSEYKAEIGRLKAENDANMKYIRMMGIQSHIKTLNEQLKQAKIDVLNKAKEKLDSAPNGWAYTTYIDELIEEVEK